MNQGILDLLPSFNALCNITSLTLIISGLFCIRNGFVKQHKTLMILAFVFSCIFLVGYLTRHYYAGSTPFPEQGAVRILYFTILITHTILAMVNLPLILTTLYFAFRDKIEKHKKIAKWTAGIWMYVNATGVIIYFMLYQIYQ